MKRLLVTALLGGLIVSLEGCYSYRIIQDVTEASPESKLRVTTTEGRSLDLISWEVDSSGRVTGIYRSAGRDDRPVQIPYRDIKTLEVREFDQTTTIVWAVVLGIPLALVIYFTIALWDFS